MKPLLSKAPVHGHRTWLIVAVVAVVGGLLLARSRAAGGAAAPVPAGGVTVTGAPPAGTAVPGLWSQLAGAGGSGPSSAPPTDSSYDLTVVDASSGRPSSALLSDRRETGGPHQGPDLSPGRPWHGGASNAPILPSEFG